MTEQELQSAHKHCTDNRVEISLGQFCGCFHCLGRYAAEFVENWLSEGAGTAICPLCQIDSVIGEASGLPVEDRAFLKSMHEVWFERTKTWAEFEAARS